MKYENVADSLEAAITDGTYVPGEQLPSIETLCTTYGVSKITVNKALGVIESRGLITRRRGSGSFVKSAVQHPDDHASFETNDQLGGLTAERRRRGDTITSTVHTFEVMTPPPEVARLLSLEEDQFVYHIVRSRYANGEPHAVQYTYIPIDIVPNLRRANVEASTYDYIEGTLGLRIASAHRTVRAVSPTPDECTWLHVEPSDPLLEIDQVSFLDDGRPFERCVSHHPNGYEFRSISTK